MRFWNVSTLRRENLIFLAGKEQRRALKKRDVQSFLLYTYVKVMISSLTNCDLVSILYFSASPLKYVYVRFGVPNIIEKLSVPVTLYIEQLTLMNG